MEKLSTVTRASMVTVTSGSGERAARALRFVLLLVVGVALVHYIWDDWFHKSRVEEYFKPVHEKAVKRNEAVPDQQPKPTAKPYQNQPKTSPRKVTSAKPIVDIKKVAPAPPPAPETALPMCPETPPNLGPVSVENKTLTMKEVETKYSQLSWGGQYKPPNCNSRHKIAILVPYRYSVERKDHLPAFLNHLHSFLMKKELDYGMYIIEQEGAKRPFNRAKLLNIGFVESRKLRPDWQCFLIHDVDLLPLDLRNLYTCPSNPRHLAAAIDAHNFQMPYGLYFGGVCVLTGEQFTKVNGLSNKYWGWGAEDDDFVIRLSKKGYSIERLPLNITRYQMLKHNPAPPNPDRVALIKNTSDNMENDGLSTLKYKVVALTQTRLFTKILVNIDED